jgi:hypothetical protein
MLSISQFLSTLEIVRAVHHTIPQAKLTGITILDFVHALCSVFYGCQIHWSKVVEAPGLREPHEASGWPEASSLAWDRCEDVPVSKISQPLSA